MAKKFTPQVKTGVATIAAIGAVISLILGVVGFITATRLSKVNPSDEKVAYIATTVSQVNATGQEFLTAWATNDSYAQELAEKIGGAARTSTIYPETMKAKASINPTMLSLKPLDSSKNKRWVATYRLDFTSNGIRLYSPFTAQIIVVVDDTTSWVENNPIIGKTAYTFNHPQTFDSGELSLNSPSGVTIVNAIVGWYRQQNIDAYVADGANIAPVLLPDAFTGEPVIKKIRIKKMVTSSSGDELNGTVDISIPITKDFSVGASVPISVIKNSNGGYSITKLGQIS